MVEMAEALERAEKSAKSPTELPKEDYELFHMRDGDAHAHALARFGLTNSDYAKDIARVLDEKDMSLILLLHLKQVAGPVMHTVTDRIFKKDPDGSNRFDWNMFQRISGMQIKDLRKRLARLTELDCLMLKPKGDPPVVINDEVIRHIKRVCLSMSKIEK